MLTRNYATFLDIRLITLEDIAYMIPTLPWAGERAPAFSPLRMVWR